jgi:uncharacterized repeat protein (TIGR01451 family)
MFRVLGAIVLALALGQVMVAGRADAQALDIDWIANINDTGFDPTPAGGTVNYAITVTNNGFDAAPATTVTLSVPATTTFTGSTGTITGCTPTPSTGPSTVTCNVPPLVSNASATLTASIRSSSQRTITFGVAVATAGDVDTTNNTATENTTITAGSDIGLTVTGPATVGAGGNATYTFTVTNNGPDPVSSLVITVPVPTGLANITPPAGCVLGGSTYTCTIAGPIAVGASVNRAFTGQISVASGSTVTVAGSVASSIPTDPITTNNTATTNTSVTGGSDVSITKTRAPAGALFVGDTVNFTLAARYTGDSPSGLTITDTIPANYSITSVTPSGGSGWSCTVAGQTITCTRTSGAGPGANISLGSITIATTVVSAGTPTNTATISSAGPTDPIPANNTATDGGATISSPTVDLQANKTGPNPPLMAIGNVYAFNISTTNNGNRPFVGTLVMTDNLPAGLVINSYVLNGWTCTPAAPQTGPSAITCQRVFTAGAPLAVGATTPVVTFNTRATTAGVLVNQATTTSPNPNFPDPNLANNTTNFSVTAQAAPNTADLRVTKTAGSASVVSGNVQTFTIEGINTGPSTATNVTLADNLTNLINGNNGPLQGFVGVTFTANAATGVTCGSTNSGGTSRRLTCTVASLPVCTPGVDCPVFTVQVRPGGNAGARTNTVSFQSSDVADPVLANNTATANFAVTAQADVSVAKNATPSPATAGQNLTYVLTASNLANGLSAADNVTVTDTLPQNVTFVSATPSAGSCGTQPASGSTTGPGNNQLVCNLGTINNGAQRTVTVIVRPNTVTRGTSITNSVTVSTTTPETDGTNNAASVVTPIQNPALDLLVNKIDSVDPVAVGDTTVYTISVTNIGPSAAENVVVNDPLPPGNLSFQSVSTSAGGSCGTVPAVNSVGGTVQCSFPTLAAGQSATVSVTMQGVLKGTATNTATVSSDETVAGFDTDPSNNTEGEVTTVRTRVDLQVVSKTASPATVNLRDPFTFTIVVRNNVGPLLAEADGTVISDTLPAGMVLTGTPTLVVNSGSVTSSTCTGVAGGTSFTCPVGTFTNGGQVTITVPVRVVSVTAQAQLITNSASVTTTSRDIDPTNDTNSGSVSVNSSSIAGTVFRDFANDVALNGSDTGVAGVTMTLTGTAFDGAPISATVTTAADGTYVFPFLPQGNYTITRGVVSEPYLTNGTNSVGNQGGSLSGATQITGISLPGATAGTGYLFALIPQARIGIAKAVTSGPNINADGSFGVTFRMTVQNPSLEALNAITVTDTFQGAAPRFGTFASLPAPATSPMTAGTYAILTAPSGTCGGANGGFNGAAATTVASGFTLAAGASCTIDVTLRVQPTVPFPPVLPSGGRYENQATVTGTGALSGQTSATNPQLSDLSDNGTNADPNGNGQANEAGENDPTPVPLTYSPAIALVKTVDTSALANPPVAGNVLTYRFAVTNTGNVVLSNVTVTDPLTGLTLTGGPIPTLAPGVTDSTTFTGTLTLTQAQIDSGSLTNQATATGTDTQNNPVTDLSGTAVGNDTPLVTPLTAGPGIAVVKTANAAGIQNPTRVGDPITYSFTVTNTGNTTLTNVTLTDPLPGLTLTGGPIATLAPGASDGTTFSGTYAVTQADIDAGQVQNQATVSGTPPSGPAVTDLSGSLPTTDDPTVVPLTQGAAIGLVKTADTSAVSTPAQVGDTITYRFTVTNTGTVTLTNVTLADPLPGLTLTGGPIASLAPGASDTTTFAGTYLVTAGDLAAGQVVNTATVTGRYGPGGSLTVTAPSTATAQVLTIQAVPEVFPPFTTDGGTTTSMLASDTLAAGPATLANVTITVLGTSNPGVTLNPATGLITLAPGLPAGPYTVDYQICAQLVPTVCSTATETVYQAPIGRIETTKTLAVTDNGDGVTGVGDTVTFTITVENLSNTSVNGLTLSDTFTDNTGGPLTLDSGPTFVSASAGSPQGTLQIGETATYTATHVLTVATVTAGGVTNQVTANGNTVVPPGLPPSVVPVPVSDVSDDGNDTDGNTVDDPTVLNVNPSLAAQGISVTKTTPLGVVTRGSVVPYTITIRNDNPVVAGQLNIVDVLPPGFLYVQGSATLGGVPATVTVAGRVVTWPNVPVPPLSTVIATLNARVTTSAPAGESVNRVSVRDPATNGLLAPVATATVRILPEPVFDCGDVIGKVWEDKNRDGYQNDWKDEDDRNAGLPKGDSGPEKARGVTDDPVEPGVPGVRLAGVDGTIITTDAFGRFHVPCAMLPQRHGSNFILKLDTRSLPAGWRVTTENPRVVRLTPGKMTEMNFGVSAAKVVRIDLGPKAFGKDKDGKPALTKALADGIDGLVPKIAGEAPTVVLAFHVAPDADAATVARANRLMQLVKTRLDRLWADQGRTKLTVETVVVRSDG